MSKRIAAFITHQPLATADGANLADSTYPVFIQGGTGTQRVSIMEIMLNGQSPVSAIILALLARDSAVATGAVTMTQTLTDAPMDSAVAPLATPALVGNTAATTKPQRSAALHLMPFGLNAFGGMVRWLAAPGEEVIQTGASANTGETSLSAFTGSAVSTAIGGHIVYETM